VVPVHETYDFLIAQRMASSWAWLSTPFSPNAPGYLVALAAVFRVAGASWWVAVLFNATLGALTTLILYRIGEKRLGHRVGFAAALWLGACVSQIHYASLVARDVLTVFLLVWFVYSIVASFHRMRSAVWSGFLFLLLVYTEPAFLLLLPVVLIFLGLRATHHRVLSAQYLCLFVSTVFVLALPWAARNYAVYGDVVPISLKAARYTNPGVLLNPAAPNGEGLNRGAEFVHNTIEYWRFARFTEAAGDAGVGPRPEPAWSLRHNLAMILSFGVLLPFFCGGVVIAWQKRKRAALVLAGVVICHALLRSFLGGSEEARLPVEPLVILLAFYGLNELLIARRDAGTAAADADA
jgi:4-amino-4-deoxy-L-arabinose transferase-like glycosyltransferase